MVLFSQVVFSVFPGERRGGGAVGPSPHVAFLLAPVGQGASREPLSPSPVLYISLVPGKHLVIPQYQNS